MRIAQLTYSYQPIIGGADAYAELLCQTFRQRGHEVWVYQRAAHMEDPFVQVAPRWQARFRPRDFWLVPHWLRTQRRELRAFEVLVAHYPNYCRAAYFHPRLIGLSHGVTWDDSPHTWRSRIKRRIAQEAFARCSRFVANDTFFLREMGLDIAPATRAFEEVAKGRWYIPNCVDTSVFTPDADERPPSILVPRNLYRNRGVHLAVEGFAQVAGRLPDYEMLIVGADSEADYAASVRALVARIGLSGRVHFVGSVPWNEMPRVYRRCRVCLIPSLCGEGTSLAALEAMACGVATVTTTAGGLLDLPAVHCPPTAQDLAQALERAVSRWREIADEQRETVRSQFSLDYWREAWINVVENW